MSSIQPKRTSRRLAGQKKRRLEEEETSATRKKQNRECYRPKATDPAILQDCGILPSE